MIKLINNEYIKIKKYKLVLSKIIYIFILILMNKYSELKIIDSSLNIIPVIGIFICLFWSGTISKEIENGTFRFYLTKPIKRYKIYLSKLLSIFIYIYSSSILILLLSSFIYRKIDLLYYSKFFTYSIPLYFLASFILYLSTKFKSTSFIITISILLFSFSLTLSQLLFRIKINFIEYLFLPYMDFSLFDDKVSLDSINSYYNISLSLKNGFIINVAYLLFFYIIGCISFIKKDIKA